MNNLEKAFGGDKKKYREALTGLYNELIGYANNVEILYSEKNYASLKQVSHHVRNIAGALGYSKLKFMSASWEDVCETKGSADIQEYKKQLFDVLRSIKSSI